MRLRHRISGLRYNITSVETMFFSRPFFFFNFFVANITCTSNKTQYRTSETMKNNLTTVRRANVLIPTRHGGLQQRR